MLKEKFRGIVVPIVTVFRSDGSIDAERMKTFVGYLIDECRVHGIFCPGSTGDYTLLTLDERKSLIELIVKHVDGRVPVYAGTGHNATQTASALTRFAQEVGADAALVSLPHYPRPTQEGLYVHYCTLAQESDIPIMVYNYPGGMGLDISPEIVARLAKEDRIQGIKDSVDDLDHTNLILRDVGDQLAVFQGMDAKLFQSLVMGCVGLVGTVSNIAPKQFVAIWDAVQKGDYEQARSLQLMLLDLCLQVTYEQGVTKAALELMGFHAGAHRLPVTPASSDRVKRVRVALDRLGLLGQLKSIA